MNILRFLGAVVLAATLTEVTSLTNKEFFELVEPYITVTEEIDISEGEDAVRDADDVIALPGGPDDEVDVEYLVQKLGLTFTEDNDDTEVGEARSVGWWHHHHHHHHHHHVPPCHCHHTECTCCLSHTWSVNLIFKHIHFHLHACVEVAYLSSNIGFEMTIIFNGHHVYHKEISLKHPPALCYGVPPLRRFVRVCVEVYNVNLAAKSMCIRLVGVVDLKIKKFRVHLKLACFRIPLMDANALMHMTQMLTDPELLQIEVLPQATNENEDDKPLDLSSVFRELQMTMNDESD